MFTFNIDLHPVRASRRGAMKGLLGAVCMIPLVLGFGGPSAAAQPTDLEAADALFEQGKFPEAEKVYARVAANDAKNHRAAVQLGRIALLSNRFQAAEKWLTTVLQLKSDDAAAKQLLAQTYYRQDQFSKAAPLLREVGDSLKAELLEGFEGVTPYQIEGSQEARLEFAQLDPIPVVKVKVNGKDAYFIIDTGGSEVYLEPHFAKEVGAHIVGGDRIAGFAGGQKASVQVGQIDSLTLDSITVKNLPVNIVDTKFIGRDTVAPDFEISGFLGTILLYHFLPTLDYANSELVLRRRTERNLKALEKKSGKGDYTILPLWMAGDHLMLTWGSANDSQSHLFLVDTGGAGLGFVPGPSIVEEAKIDVGDTPESAGALQIYRFTTDKVSLGPLTRENLPSAFGPFPAQMEDGLGFRMAGIVTHEFFKPYGLTIDFTKMRYFLKMEE